MFVLHRRLKVYIAQWLLKMKKLKAIGYNGSEFAAFEKQIPEVTGRDLLVEVKAVSINPIDSKLKHMLGGNIDNPRILGFDGCGIVKAAGQSAHLFKVGDEVYYAGDMTRDGSNANLQLIDERIVGHKPKSFSYTEAAAMPLCAVTAWESLFERLGIGSRDSEKTVLLIGAAGGVGSIAIQLAKQVAKLKVVATASREESKDWCQKMGADIVLDHHNLQAQFQQKKLTAPEYILCMGVPDDYLLEMIEVVAPQGAICLLANVDQPFDLNLLKPKSIRLAWEMMFTRSKFETQDMGEQGKILDQLSKLIDSNQIISIQTCRLNTIDAASVAEAHKVIEAGKMIGKLSLSRD